MRKLMMPLLVLFGVGFVAVNAARADDEKPADAKPAKKAKRSRKAKKADAAPAAGAPAADAKPADAPASP